MQIVVMGCGRVGSRVANALNAAHDVTVVDWSASAFDRLSAEFSGRTILGNGIDADVLRSAGVGSANIFLALTDNDNRNLMAAQVASRLGARKVIARVYDPVRARVFGAMGVVTVCPTTHGARALFDLVTAPLEGA